MVTKTFSSFTTYMQALSKLRAAGYIHVNESWMVDHRTDRSMLIATTHVGELFIDVRMPIAALSVL
jgi:hypothetical protein